MGTPYTGKKPMQPHRDLIIAWANGAEIQSELDGEWIDTPTPSWSINADYRIKPQLKVDSIAYMNNRFGLGWREDSYPYTHADEILRLYRDAETGKVKSVEVVK